MIRFILFFTVSVCLTLLYYKYKPPHIELQQQADGSVLLSNTFLDEYYLGFDRLVFKSVQNDTVLCTFKPISALTLKLKAGAGINGVADKLSDQNSVASTGQDCLLKPQQYRVEVWGNNASGRITKSTLWVDLAINTR